MPIQITEEFLCFVYQFRLFNEKKLFAETGELIEILEVGSRNYDAGPDFLNARVKIDQTIWVGNVEIHRSSSDWFRHKHHEDDTYNNVVLHVVYEISNQEVVTKNGVKIPEISLLHKIKKTVLDRYEKFGSFQKSIPCAHAIKEVDELTLQSMLDRMVTERLEEKTAAIRTMLETNKGNWDETFYIILSGNFGLNVNKEPFQRLARSLNLKVLARNKNDLTKVEALLFGQAGFLEGNLFF